MAEERDKPGRRDRLFDIIEGARAEATHGRLATAVGRYDGYGRLARGRKELGESVGSGAIGQT